MKLIPPKDKLLQRVEQSTRTIDLEAMQIEIDNPSIEKQYTEDEWIIINSYMQTGNTVESIKQLNPNITRREAKEKAITFFEKPKVKTEIKRRINISINYNIQLIDTIIREYSSIAFANIDDFVKWDNGIVTLVPSHELTRQQKAGVAEVKQTLHGVSIKLFPKLPALDSMAKILNLLKETIDLTSTDGSFDNKERSVVILPDNSRGGLKDD